MEPVPERIEVLAEELAEYALCALRHLYRFHYRQERRAVDRIEIGTQAIRETLLWFYNALAERTNSVSLRDLLKRIDWEIVERGGKIGLSPKELAPQLAHARVIIERAFEEEAQGLVILGARVPYERVLRQSNVEVVLRGEIDVVRVRQDHRSKERTLELVHLDDSRYLPRAVERANDIRLICARLGWATYRDEVKGKNLKLRSFFFSIHNDMELEAEIHEEELLRACGWLVHLAKAVHHKLYFPQFDHIRCKLCPYRLGCEPMHISAPLRDAPEKVARRLRELLEKSPETP